MRILWSGSLSVFLLFLSAFPALSQDAVSASSRAAAADAPATEPGVGPTTEAISAPPASFNDVMDRVIQKEHLFVAQIRHLRPLVETYLQDLKTDGSGNSQTVKDQYFLGRLDMSDGPEDTSFVGEPGFGHRMLNHLTGLYAMHFLPLGFAQMIVLDTDFQKSITISPSFDGSFSASCVAL